MNHERTKRAAGPLVLRLPTLAAENSQHPIINWAIERRTRLSLPPTARRLARFERHGTVEEFFDLC